MSEKNALAAVLDALIPPCTDRGMPGAGELGLAEHLRASVPDLMPLVDGALADLTAIAREGGAEDFASLAPEARQRALSDLSERQPALLPGLLFQTYQAYYAHPEVLAALGVPGRPPHPLGYEMEPNDLSLLENVRARTKLYRDA